PPKAQKYYEATPDERAAVIVRFDDDDDPAKRRPALVERTVGKDGKVLLLTTRLDVTDVENRWNDYWANSEQSFATVFPHVVMSYLCGAAADKNYQYPTGRDLTLPVPRGTGKEPPKKLKLEGPGVTGRDAEFDLGEKQTEVRLTAAKTLTPG